MEVSIGMTRERLRKDVQAKAELAAEERVVEALVGNSASSETKLRFRHKIRDGELNDREVDIEVTDTGGPATFEIPGMPGGQVGMVNIGDMLGKALAVAAPRSAP